MTLARWFSGALVGGLVGAVAWIAIVYFTDYELGIVAWGIGFLAGFGTRLFDRQAEGPGPAATAVLAALLCFAIGKVGSVALLMGWPGASESHEWTTIYLADTIAREVERSGGGLDWPGEARRDTAVEEEDYPAEVWVEAERRWDAIPAEEQTRYLQDQGHARLLDREWVISFLADDVAGEYETLGRELAWPESAADMRMDRDDYPSDVWEEAEARWRALSPAEQRAFEENRVAPALMPGSESSMVLMATAYSMSLWDLLWLGLAAVSAWKVGFGGDDEPGETAGGDEPAIELPPEPERPR